MLPSPERLAYLRKLLPPPPYWGGTGAVERRPDSRDYPASWHPGFARAAALPTADSVDWSNKVCSITNQGATGACVAYSTCNGIQVNEEINSGICYQFNCAQLYAEMGGTGSNGVDSRGTLDRCQSIGAPLVNSSGRMRVGSYFWIDQNPATFEAQVKAALTAGKSVVLALLLPSTFSGRWTPGNPTTGYHQVDLVGFQGDLFWGPNSWGPEWPGSSNHPPGFYELAFSYCLADGLQHNYCFAYFFDTVLIAPPTPTPVPPVPTPVPPVPTPVPPVPTPTPVPSPTMLTVVTGPVQYPNADQLAAGQTLTFGSTGTILLTAVTRQEVPPVPTPTPVPPVPTPTPTPEPPPGTLVINTAVGRGKWLYVTVQDAGGGEGAYLGATCHLTFNGADMGTSQTTPRSPTALPARFYLGSKTGTGIVNVGTDDGRTGTTSINV